MKNKVIYISIFVLTLISFMIGFSYAYFTTKVIGNDLASSNKVGSGSLKINYYGNDYISLNEAEPGDFSSFLFSVENGGTEDISSYEIYFSNLINTFLYDELVYEISCTSSDAIPCNNKGETIVPSTSSLALLGAPIAVGTTHNYTVKVTFKELGISQDYNQNQEFYLTISINEQYEYQTLVARAGDTSTELFWGFASSITKIEFQDKIKIPGGTTYYWDVSTSLNGGIMAYLEDDGLGAGTYVLYIQANSGLVLANPDSSNLFNGFINLKEIVNFSNLSTYKTTDFSWMFANCNSLLSIDLSNFNTKNAYSMDAMFYECSSLTELDLSSFKTDTVERMSWTFMGLASVTELDLSRFVTTNVSDMSGMFENCFSVTSLDLGNFYTSNVITMAYMFAGCNDLISLDIRSFNTTNVTEMQAMFSGCQSLVSLDVSNFNTAIVTDMSNMFRDCSSLTSLDVTNFITSNVINMSSMFRSVVGITSLDLSSFDTSNVTTMYAMFRYCTNLLTLDLSSFDTTSLTSTDSMFYQCYSLTSIDLSSFDTSLVTTTYYMFRNCEDLVTIYISNLWNMSLVTISTSMFQYCYSLSGAIPYNSLVTDVTHANYQTGYLTLKV